MSVIIPDNHVRPNFKTFFTTPGPAIPPAKLTKTEFADRAAGAILGSIIGDALGTGPHWYYDLDLLKQRYGRVTGYVEPKSDWFHAGLPAGSNSQTGEFSIALAESVASAGAYDHLDFCKRVDLIFDTLDPNELTYSGRSHYTDRATRDLYNARRHRKLEWTDKNIGASWTDTTEGSQRGIVLAARYAADKSLNKVAGAVWQNTRIQYADATVLAHNVAFDCITALLIQGNTFSANSLVPEIYKLVRSGLYTLNINVNDGGVVFKSSSESKYKDEFGVVDRSTENPDCFLLPTFILRGVSAGGKIDPDTAALMYGQSCAINCVMSSSYYYAAHFQQDFDGAILGAVNGGGQTVARCAHVGALVGAQVGVSGINAKWIDGLENGQHIKQIALQIGQQAAHDWTE